MSLDSLIAHYGWLAVLVGSAVEGETAVFLGGVFSRHGLLPYWTVAGSAALGSFAADQLFFFLGRYARTYPRIQKILARPAFSWVLHMLGRYPTGFILAFRFLYGLRVVSPMAIGASSIPALKFFVLNALAALLWALVISAAGFLFGQGIEQIFGHVSLSGHAVAALGFLALVLAIAGVTTVLVRHKR